MKKIISYKSGERYYMNGMTLGIHGGEISKEYDLTKATSGELEQLKINPYNDSLLSQIEKRH